MYYSEAPYDAAPDRVVGPPPKPAWERAEDLIFRGYPLRTVGEMVYGSSRQLVVELAARERWGVLTTVRAVGKPA